jgi:2,5-dihydroxypyridine 5,6-dioxygenase
MISGALPALPGAANCVRLGNVQPGEEVLILAEPGTDRVVIEALSICARLAGARVNVLFKEPSPVNEPLSPVLGAAIRAADILFNLSYPTSHSHAGFLASFDHGTRSLTVRPDAAVLASPAAMFPLELFFELGKRSQALVRGAASVRVSDERGTDFRVSPIPGSVGAYIGALPYEPGLAVPGYIGTFPPGTTVWGDLNYSANGTLVLDAVYQYVAPSEPVTWTVTEGWVTSIAGGPEADEVSALVAPHRNGNRFAECGFGLNPKIATPHSVPSGTAGSAAVLSWTRRAGTFFVGMGGNTLMGGRDRSNVLPVYGLIRRPTVTVGDVVIIRDGRFTWLDDPDADLLAHADRVGGAHWLQAER